MTGLVCALEAVSKKSADLFAIEFGGAEIVFRLPSVRQASQYARLLMLANGEVPLESIIYEHIFSTAVEDNYLAYNDGNIPAGVITLAQLIENMFNLGSAPIHFLLLFPIWQVPTREPY